MLKRRNGPSLLNCKKDVSNRNVFIRNVGHNDPIVLHGKAIAQQIKGTLGITGLCFFRVRINENVWHLDVGLAYPKGAEAFKGLTVRRLKCYMNWVQNVVRQFGLYLVFLNIKNKAFFASTRGPHEFNP